MALNDIQLGKLGCYTVKSRLLYHAITYIQRQILLMSTDHGSTLTLHGLQLLETITINEYPSVCLPACQYHGLVVYGNVT